MDRRSPEQKDLGKQLQQAEEAIHLGRQAMERALACVPPDMAGYATQQIVVHEARLARNSLRHQLAATKRGISPQRPYSAGF